MNNGVIINRIKLVGSKGEKKVDALFDSGASFSFIKKLVASKLGLIDALSTLIEFETAEEGRKIKSRRSKLLDYQMNFLSLKDYQKKLL